MELSSGITLCIEILRAVLVTDDKIRIKTQLTLLREHKLDIRSVSASSSDFLRP